MKLETIHLDPMTFANPTATIDRWYRECLPGQYLRELGVNAFEAGATRVVYGVEWEAVRVHGVYRLVVADNGVGMTRHELETYMKTLGVGAKPIGGEHENFGIGARNSLLAWNKFGVIVVSFALNKESGQIEGWMMRLRYDPLAGRYGAHHYTSTRPTDNDEVETITEITVDPAEVLDEGICYENVLRNAFASPAGGFTGTGTAVICLGDTGAEDTIQRPTSTQASEGEFEPQGEKGSNVWIVNWLNRRFFAVPQGAKVYVEVLAYKDREKWPKTRDVAAVVADGDKSIRLLEVKQAYGANRYLSRPGKEEKDNPVTAGDPVMLADGTLVHWYLRKRAPSGSQGAFGRGVIATLYNNELYNPPTTRSETGWRYRQFGIVGTDLQRRLSLVLEPPLAAPDRLGVFPDSCRSSLHYRDDKGTNWPSLPWAQWGEEFGSRMPKVLRAESDKSLASLIGGGSWKVEDFRDCWHRWYGADIVRLPPEQPKPGEGRQVNFIERPDGPGVPTRGGSGKKGGKEPRESAERYRPTIVSKENIRWADFAGDGRFDLAEHARYAAYFAADGTLFFNETFPLFRSARLHAIDYVRDHATLLSEEERETKGDELVRNAYELIICCRLYNSAALRRAADWSTAAIRELCRDPNALTFGTMGVLEVNDYVEHAVAKLKRPKTKGGRKDPAASPSSETPSMSPPVAATA